MSIPNPKCGELWEINMWAPEGNTKFPVLVLKETSLSEDQKYKMNIQRAYTCIQDGRITQVPDWMFLNAQLVSGKKISL
jgi:hypothetical protein